MRFLTKPFRTISKLQITAKQNDNFVVCRTNFSSAVTPVQMAVDVFKTDATNLNASPLIIMHGLFGSKQNWRAVGRALESKTKRKIYTVDARNHGDSPHVDEHSSEEMAADVALLMKMEKIERASVMGHSMGGRTMMFFALKYPQLVEKAIIVDISPVSIPRNFGTMEDIFLAMKNISVSPDLSMADGRAVVYRQMIDAVRDKETVDFIMLNLRKSKTGEFIWRQNVESLHKNFGHFRNTQQFNMPPFMGPMLFIGGKQSNFLDPEDWPAIKKIFPNAELQWLDSGHLVHFEQPAKFMELVTGFLKS